MVKNDWIKIVVAYEHSEDGMRARKMMDRIAGKLEPGCCIDSELWDFDLIADHSLSQDAATAAKEADMIIIAVRSGLPGHVRNWLEQWASDGRRNPVSIVVLHEPEQTTEDCSALLAYLQKLTAQGGADLFWHSQDPGTQGEWPLEETPLWFHRDILGRYEISNHRQ
jgi:hypothetical protein